MYQQVFPQYETKVTELVGGEDTSDGFNGARELIAHGLGTYTQHNQNILPQLNSEVVNLTGLLKIKD